MSRSVGHSYNFLATFHEFSICVPKSGLRPRLAAEMVSVIVSHHIFSIIAWPNQLPLFDSNTFLVLFLQPETKMNNFSVPGNPPMLLLNQPHHLIMASWLLSNRSKRKYLSGQVGAPVRRSTARPIGRSTVTHHAICNLQKAVLANS